MRSHEPVASLGGKPAAVACRSVERAYHLDAAEVPALRGVDLTIARGSFTALVGPSGSGKSTLLAALAGLMPVSSGTITSGGRVLGGPAWQSQVAWLPQQPQFLEGTIADNLRLARPDATDAQLWDALRQVALEVRVQELSDGLDSPLGEDGATLSAGEQARLALARIVLAERPWMLLDEPTAHLDELTERVILDTIGELGRRGAVVVVAHRPALVAQADHQLRLTAPPVVAQGAQSRGSDTSHPGKPVQAAQLRGSGEDQAPAQRAFLSSTLIGAAASASGCAPSAWPARCCGTSSGCAPTTPRWPCSPGAGSRSTTPWCRWCQGASGGGAETC